MALNRALSLLLLFFKVQRNKNVVLDRDIITKSLFVGGKGDSFFYFIFAQVRSNFRMLYVVMTEEYIC